MSDEEFMNVWEKNKTLIRSAINRDVGQRFAEDVLQDVFVKAWKHRRTIDADRAMQYIWTIRKTHIFDILNRKAFITNREGLIYNGYKAPDRYILHYAESDVEGGKPHPGDVEYQKDPNPTQDFEILESNIDDATNSMKIEFDDFETIKKLLADNLPMNEYILIMMMSEGEYRLNELHTVIGANKNNSTTRGRMRRARINAQRIVENFYMKKYGKKI